MCCVSRSAWACVSFLALTAWAMIGLAIDGVCVATGLDHVLDDAAHARGETHEAVLPVCSSRPRKVVARATTLRRVDELLEWYGRVARDLPWRRTADPYAILVSEVMLQQTQVARVIERYEAWLARWPTVEGLAAASLGDVLTEWVGLGYIRRAKALWEAARVVAEAGWPEKLTRLPGVGPYTAAAVGSFAFGRDELAIDTNARRVYGHRGFTPAVG